MKNYFDRNPVLLYLGKKVVEKILDKSIQEVLEAFSDPKARLLHEKLISFSQKQIDILEEIVPYIITGTVSNMLCFFEENEDIQLMIDFEGERINIAEVSDGLYGDLNGKDGWIDRFGKYIDFVTEEARKQG